MLPSPSSKHFLAMQRSVRLGNTLLSIGVDSRLFRFSSSVHVKHRSAPSQAVLQNDCPALRGRRFVTQSNVPGRARLRCNDVQNGLVRHSAARFLTTSGAETSKGSSESINTPNPQQPQTPSASTQTSSTATTAPKPASEPQSSLQPPPTAPKPSEPQSSSEFAEQDKKPLPYLSAPLGMPDRPSSKKLTWIEKRDRQFDTELRMKRRKAIVKDATRGYFHDIHAMRSHGGKTWLAPTTLIRQDRALYFPAIAGSCLANKYTINTADMLPGKVSLVCILTSQVSEEHVKSFYSSTYELYKNDRDFQLVQINLQENYLKAALVSIFMSSLRRQMDESLHKTYMLSHQDLTVERDAIALHNKHVGYIYLVGPDCKIRWAGGGFAERHESQALVACTGVLLSRLAEEEAGSGKTGTAGKS